MQRDLISFLPGLKVRRVKDYTLAISGENTSVVELRLNADFILPLKDHKALEEHDLMAHLTGHMTKLLPDELVAFQIVTVPVFSETHLRVVRRQQHIEGRIALGREVWSQLKRQRTPLGYALWLLWYPPLYVLQGIAKVFVAIVGLVGLFLSTDHELPGFMDSNDKRRPDNPYDLEMGKLVKAKLDQQLFEVTLRILVSSPDDARRGSRIDALGGTFRPLRSTYQSIGIRQHVPLLSPKRKNLAQFKLRELAPHHLSQQTILSSSELSDLYHFPNTDITKTEGLVKSRSRELAAPLSMRRSTTDLDVMVGTNTHGGSEQPIGVTLVQRQKHMYVIGKTGTGNPPVALNPITQHTHGRF